MHIDARGKLKPEDMSKFLSACGQWSLTIKTGTQIMTTPGSDLVQTLFRLDVKDEDEITIFVEINDINFISEYRLDVLGLDVNWWNANARRRNKLLAAVISPEKKVDEPVKEVLKYDCAIATLYEGHLSDIQVYSGTKNELITKLNEDIHKRYIDSFLKAQVVIDLAYDKGDEDNLELWLSIDELKDIGAIK